jgi:hypothetical protein
MCQGWCHWGMCCPHCVCVNSRSHSNAQQFKYNLLKLGTDETYRNYQCFTLVLFHFQSSKIKKKIDIDVVAWFNVDRDTTYTTSTQKGHIYIPTITMSHDLYPKTYTEWMLTHRNSPCNSVHKYIYSSTTSGAITSTLRDTQKRGIPQIIHTTRTTLNTTREIVTSYSTILIPVLRF